MQHVWLAHPYRLARLANSEPEDMIVTTEEEYWSNRTYVETKAALAAADPQIASLHVDLATRCLRKALAAAASNRPLLLNTASPAVASADELRSPQWGDEKLKSFRNATYARQSAQRVFLATV